MSLYDILACPTCRVGVMLDGDHLRCTQCQARYPIVKGVPIMLPGGRYEEVPYQYGTRVAQSYDPWVHRMLLQSLTDGQVAVDVGSGDMRLDDPCIIRMDVKLTPHVDVVGDFHALPFLPDSVDYIFSIAVFEHLRQPFTAAEEIWRVLKPGGYVYNDANFVFNYHGYPHHYFNISIQGFEQIFARFTQLKTGVAPFHRPAFALDSILSVYLEHFRPETLDEQAFARTLREVLQHPLRDYDRRLVPSEAYRLAAGTYLIGLKQPTGSETVIPPEVWDVYHADPALQARFPRPLHVYEPDNLLYWAQTEGRREHPALAAYFDQLPNFSKYVDPAHTWDRTRVRGYGTIPPVEGHFVADTRRPPHDWDRRPVWHYLLYQTWQHVGRAEFGIIWRKVLATLAGQRARRPGPR